MSIKDLVQNLTFQRMEKEGSTYKFRTFSGDYIYLGDAKDTEFHPIVKLNRWDSECWLKLSFDDSKIPKALKKMVMEEGKVKWITPSFEFHFYPTDKKVVKLQHLQLNREVSFIQNELGGLEFEIILKQKPSFNKLVFPIGTKDLKFYYQPPLHPDHPTWADTDGDGIADNFRPENVVGSYTVYHATRTNWHRSKADAEKYKAGKAFHIYRPKVTDANGNSTWCDLNVDTVKGLLTITIPQDFLDGAVYPVVVDPTFGYETAGSSFDDIMNIIRGSVFSCPESGTADSITAYCESISGSIKFGIYKHVDSSFVGGTVENTADWIPAAWHTLSISGTVSLTATDYVLVAWSSGTSAYLYYDAGDTNQGHYQSLTYGTWPDPASFTHNNNKYSIYCTYTVSKTVSATDAYSFADAFSVRRFYARLVYDASTLGDLGVFVRTKPIYPLDVVSLADSYFSNELFMRWFSDNLTLADIASFLKVKPVYFSDLFSVEDLYSFSEQYHRSFTDNSSYADLVETVRLKFLFLSEYASLKDLAFLSRAVNRYFSDDLSFKDLAETFKRYFQSLVDAFSIYDLTSLLKTKPVYFTERFKVSDVYNFTRVYYRVFSDFLELSDLLSKFKGIAEYFYDSVSFKDVFVQNRFYQRYLTDYASLEDFVWFVREKFLSTLDSFSLYDLAFRIRWKVLVFTEPSTLGDLISYKRFYQRVFSDGFNFLDVYLKAGMYRLLFYDYFSVKDMFSKFAFLVRRFVDAYTVYESYLTSRLINRYFTESYSVKDVYSKSSLLYRLIYDSFKLIDSVDRMLVKYVKAAVAFKTIAQQLEGVIPVYKTIAQQLEEEG